MRACLVVVLWVLGGLAAAPASATPLFVEEWELRFDAGGGFSDDFEDGVEPLLFAGCDGIVAGDEAGGRLRMRPATPGCGGLRTYVDLPSAQAGAATLTGTWQYAVPKGLGQGYGINLGNATDFVTLGVFAFQNPILGGSQVIALLADEQFDGATNFLEFLVLPATAPTFDRVTFEIEVTEVGGVLLPHGRIGFDGGPLQDLGENGDPGVPVDRGALAGTQFATLLRIGAVAEPGGLAMLGWAGLVALGCLGRARRASR